MKPDQLKLWYSLVFCAIGLLVDFEACRPGFMSPDTFQQYGQALTGVYSDWHPPVMAFAWHLLTYVYKGPALMLGLQLAMFWTAIFLLLRTFPSWRWILAVSLFAYAPFVQNFPGYIIKDSQMALAWLLVFAITFRGIVNKRISGFEAAVSLALLMYGTCVRPNALPGAIPLAWFWVWAVFPDARRQRKAAIAVAAVLFIPAGQWVLNNAIIRPAHDYPEDKLYMHDLTGIMVKTGVNFIPVAAFPEGRPDTAWLLQKYHPATFDMAWWNKDNVNTRPPKTYEATAALSAAWRHGILAYPGVYLANRLDGFMYYLRIKKRSDEFYYYYPWVNHNKYGIALTPGVAYNRLLYPIKEQADMPYMQPWFWLLLNIAVLAFIPRIKETAAKMAVGVLALSGLMYQLPTIFIYQVDTDFRYFYWNCIGTSIALIIVVTERFAWQNISLSKPTTKEKSKAL